MSAIRFSVNDSRWKSRLSGMAKRVVAKSFEKPVRNLARNALNDCVRLTPVRSIGVIKRNQTKQYWNRANFIPSIHHKTDPMLIVTEDGRHMLHFEGRWMVANQWRINEDAYSAYMDLLNERERRLQTSLSAFVNARTPSRYLYQKSWWQVGQSLDIPVTAPASVRSSNSRHNPPSDPPRGYGQMRGGLQTLSVVIYNPFLEMPSTYKPFSGKVILATAIRKNEGAFYRDVERELNVLCR